jgi:hypothetical protein
MVYRMALPALLVVAAYLAVSMHRAGHTQGDDFALYLRQARSLFDGDPSGVIADNRFAVLNSDGAFSPIGYPWGWPLMLSPFVHFWGFDFAMLKLVEVGLLCVWLAFLHGVVQRRLGRWAALGIVAVFGTAPAFLAHTDQLITEIPHLATVGLFLWWCDRVATRSTLLSAPTRDLVVVGLLAAFVFNVRREGLVLVVVVAAIQLYDLWRDERGSTAREAGEIDDDDAVDAGSWYPVAEVMARARRSWTALATPHLAFAGAVAVFQIMLPTALLPDNGNSISNFADRYEEYPTILSDQLGLGENGWVGALLLVVAAVGVAVGVRQRPRLDGTIVVLAVMSSLLISTHIRQVDRYWFQVTPWVVYFVVVACLAAAKLVRLPATAARGFALVPLAVMLGAHALALPGDVRAVSDFNDADRVQFGPSHPAVIPVYSAVHTFTPPDAIVAFFRARTMTLLTDRRSFQSANINRIAMRADYFAQQRESTYWQPDVAAAQQAGFEQVWADERWILWRVDPDEGGL